MISEHPADGRPNYGRESEHGAEHDEQLWAVFKEGNLRYDLYRADDWHFIHESANNT